MGIVIRWRDHVRASSISTGHKSGRNSLRETPVSFSIGSTNSAGTPFLERISQYQTCDCVVPMRSAKGFCPPAKSQARLSASVDIAQSSYPFLGESQPKNLCRTTNLNFGSFEPMKEANPIAFGNRVRERRNELGLSQDALADRSGYSQSNIGWVEKGQAKRPHIQAQALAEALWTTSDWLLWEKGPKDSGPPILSAEEFAATYNLLSIEARAALSQAAIKYVEATKQKRKIR